VLATHNLALGVLAGVLLSALFFANKIGRLMVVKQEQAAADVQLHYQVVGQVFFASSEKFTESFDFSVAAEKVVIDLTRAHFWDITAVAALDSIVIKYQRLGAEVDIIGINEASKTVIDKFAVHNDPKALEKILNNN
ncbi:MAG TPA: STAS domain-containing protein, partial [Pseudomonadales bacterium]|nr:STAS domain-containing protein [Pseudomonadales bacterium]